MNKAAAGVLLAGLVAMVSGKVADALYHPHPAEKRGFEVEVAQVEEAGAAGGAVAEAPVDILPLLAKADAKAGEEITKKCAACHDFTKGGPNKVGPNLYGIIGHPKAGHAGFAYSDAMKAKGGHWDFQALSDFLHKPKDFVPGTKMSFAGIKKPEDRANLIAYLRTLSDAPVALPAAK